MTVCPIAIVVGCKKCPAFAVCPVKSSLGDYVKEPDKSQKHANDKSEARAKRAK